VAVLLAALFASGVVERAKAQDLRVEAGNSRSREKPRERPEAKRVDVVTLIARARDAVANNRPSVRADINSLFEALLQSRDGVDQYNLMVAIGEIGNIRDGTSPVAVKNQVRRLIQVVFPHLRKNLRANAAMAWRGVFPSQREMEIEIGVVEPASSAEEGAGLKVLRARGVGVSYDSLQQALQRADLQIIQALLQAGLKVDRSTIERSFEAVWPSLRMACFDSTIPADWINQALDRLVAHGYPIDYADRLQHTLLHQLARDCPGAVAGHIVDLGVAVDSKDVQGVTALEQALSGDRFDVADALMERGGRISPAAARRVLLFPRQDSRRADYVRRATVAGDSPR